jgi:hypothetical protein
MVEYVIYLYEDRTLKPMEIILNEREGDERERWGDESNQGIL